MIGIGIMSGTSADGIDAACLRIEGAPPAISYELLSFVSLDMPAELREDIFRSFRPESSSSELLCQLNFRLGEIYAEAAIKAAEAAGLRAYLKKQSSAARRRLREVRLQCAGRRHQCRRRWCRS